jgi:hypothetical protein
MKRATALREVAALADGAGFSLAQLAYHCRMPTSEACVWSRAYYPVTLPIETIVFGAIFFIVVTLMLKRRER